MELLKPTVSAPRRRTLLFLSAVFALAAVSCAVLESIVKDSTPPHNARAWAHFHGASLPKGAPVVHKVGFSHAVHLENEVECAACHAGAADSAKAGMPDEATCLGCHDADDEVYKRGKDIFRDGELNALHLAALPEGVAFSHQAHSDKGIACESCHSSMKVDGLSSAVRVNKDQCLNCHALQDAPSTCETCHDPAIATTKPRTHDEGWLRLHGKVAMGEAARTEADLSVDRCAMCHTRSGCNECHEATPPAGHSGNWKRLHGGFIKGDAEAFAQNCSLCHTESGCNACHRDEAPANHTNHWRQRGHGIAASMDRDACATCHLTDSCDTCHQESAPRSHRGAWGGAQSQHCVNCHLPLANEGCAVCHQGTPSHAQATPQPGWHTPGMNCRQCHGAQQPLPHVDNGMNCNVCHQ